jgi:tetratricopeptide (TPR) repeat protein
LIRKLPCFAALLLVAAPVFAVDFARDAVPGKWVQPLAPEDLPPLTYPDYFNDWDKAKLQVATGRYKLALQTLRNVHAADKGVGAPALADMKFQALFPLGRADEAMAVVTDPAVADAPAVQLDRAVLLASIGRPAEAIAALHDHLRAHPDSIRGHFELGRLAELTDDVATAKDAYGWFIAAPQSYLDKWRGQGEKLFEGDANGAADATTVGLALDRSAVLTGGYQTDPSLNDLVLDVFVKAYDVIDRDYWPAHVAAGRYYLSHDDAHHAEEELKKALAINPRSAEALALLGRIAVSHFDFDTGDSVTASLRRLDPTSVAAELLETRNLLQQRQPRQAATAVRRVLATQPHHLEAMGLLAATEALQLHEAETKRLLAEVDRVSPADARAYLEVADQLGAMRQYPRAAAMYQVAIDRAPWWSEPRNGQGLLFTQSGDEAAARRALTAAHDIDPFNVETTNYLRLLDDMDKFGTRESAHFIVRYDPDKDPIIPEYFNDYLEQRYAEITGEYRTEPPEKTIIEVFPSHDMFSVRTTGSPWIGTVGASTGRIIALDPPRQGENTLGSFNWSQVLRHEFTHTVTLAATDNRISHWFTEGLAVYEEHSPPQWPWVPMLYSAVTKNQLFDMDQLTWAFVRPKRPNDRQLAYAESFWVCTYIERTYGHDAILHMLAEEKGGMLQQDVFPKVLGRSQDQFFTEFCAWCREQVSHWGYDADTTQQVDDLKEQGESRIADKDYPAAAAIWERIAALRPMDELPHRRLAGLYQATGQKLKAIDQFKLLHTLEAKDDKYAKAIARLYRDLGDYGNAEAYALQSIYVEPYDLSAHQLMLAMADKAGDEKGVERERRVIPILQGWMERQRAAR